MHKRLKAIIIDFFIICLLKRCHIFLSKKIREVKQGATASSLFIQLKKKRERSSCHTLGLSNFLPCCCFRGTGCGWKLCIISFLARSALLIIYFVTSSPPPLPQTLSAMLNMCASPSICAQLIKS